MEHQVVTRKNKSISHYLYLGLLFVLAILSTRYILFKYYDSSVPVIFLTILFTILNVVFGSKEIILLDQGIEKRYRFNFIINIICLLTCGPVVMVFSSAFASFIYIPITQHRAFGDYDIENMLVQVFTQNISNNLMAYIFLSLGGVSLDANFPNNVFYILIAAILNFIVNILLSALWYKFYDMKNVKILSAIKADLSWLIKYDLWQAIYAILIVNSILFYGQNIYSQYTTSQNNLGTNELAIFFGIFVVGFIFYYPIKERLTNFNMVIDSNRQNKELKELNIRVQDMNKRTIRAFISMLEARDPYTCGHSERVALYSKIMAKKLGFSDKQIETLEIAGLLHDIGKMGIDINIINKPGKLTDEEYAQIKMHPVYGEQILHKIFINDSNKDDEELAVICDIANSHHERYDGRGYPKGISGQDISLEARIIGVADCFDAMTSDRSYRKGLPMDVTLEEIKKGNGTQFCPVVVEAFIESVEDGTLTIQKDNDISSTLSVFS